MVSLPAHQAHRIDLPPLFNEFQDLIVEINILLHHGLEVWGVGGFSSGLSSRLAYSG